MGIAKKKFGNHWLKDSEPLCFRTVVWDMSGHDNYKKDFAPINPPLCHKDFMDLIWLSEIYDVSGHPQLLGIIYDVSGHPQLLGIIYDGCGHPQLLGIIYDGSGHPQLLGIIIHLKYCLSCLFLHVWLMFIFTISD